MLIACSLLLEWGYTAAPAEVTGSIRATNIGDRFSPSWRQNFARLLAVSSSLSGR